MFNVQVVDRSSLLPRSFAKPLSKVDVELEWLWPHLHFLNGLVREGSKREVRMHMQFAASSPIRIFGFHQHDNGPKMKRKRGLASPFPVPLFASFDALFSQLSLHLSSQFSLANDYMHPLDLRGSLLSNSFFHGVRSLSNDWSVFWIFGQSLSTWKKPWTLALSIGWSTPLAVVTLEK